MISVLTITIVIVLQTTAWVPGGRGGPGGGDILAETIIIGHAIFHSVANSLGFRSSPSQLKEVVYTHVQSSPCYLYNGHCIIQELQSGTCLYSGHPCLEATML